MHIDPIPTDEERAGLDCLRRQVQRWAWALRALALTTLVNAVVTIYVSRSPAASETQKWWFIAGSTVLSLLAIEGIILTRRARRKLTCAWRAFGVDLETLG